MLSFKQVILNKYSYFPYPEKHNVFLTVSFVDTKRHARGGWLRPLIIPIKLEGDPQTLMLM